MDAWDGLDAISQPGRIHVVVESPAGATSKIKHDSRLRTFTLSRPLPLGLSYPHDEDPKRLGWGGHEEAWELVNAPLAHRPPAHG